MKKILTTILMLFILSIPVCAATFPDIEGHWAQADIEAMAEAGYLNGYPDGTFRPDEPVTRAEFAKIICEVYDLPTSEYGYMMFDDVNEGDWYAKYVPAFDNLVFQNFVYDIQMYKDNGLDNSFINKLGSEYGTTFGASTPMTRVEAAYAIMTCHDYPDDEFESVESYNQSLMAAYEIASTAPDYEEFNDSPLVPLTMGMSVKRGIINGDGQGRLRPYNSLSRAELCTLLRRVLSMYPGSTVNLNINFTIRDLEIAVHEEQIIAGFLSEDKKTELDNTIVATINGVPVSQADFNLIYNDYAISMSEYFRYMGIEDWESQPYTGTEPEYVGKTYKDLAYQYAMDYVTEGVVIEQLAAEYGITVDAAVAAQIKMDFIYWSFNDGLDKYQEYLAQLNTSDYAFDKVYRQSALATELKNVLVENDVFSLTEDEILEYFIKASHVLIMTDEDTTEEEALAKANEVIAKLNAGEDMAALIAEYGEDPGMKQQDYYIFTEGEMVDEFYEGAKALAPGEYSAEPVKTAYGYHVIYRLPLNEEDVEYALTFSSEIIEKKFFDMMNALCSEAEVQVYF